MGSLRRVTSGAIVVLNILSCVLMWVCVFSKSDWVKEIRADESPFINRQQYGFSDLWSEMREVRSADLWRLHFDPDWSRGGSTYNVGRNIPLAPRDPQLTIGVVFLVIGCFIPLVQIVLLSTQLALGPVSLRSRAWDVIEFWVSISALLTVSIGSGLTVSYMLENFSFDVYGPSFYMLFIALSMLILSSLISAVKICTSPKITKAQMQRAGGHVRNYPGGNAMMMSSGNNRPPLSATIGSRSGTLDRNRGGGGGGGGGGNNDYYLPPTSGNAMMMTSTNNRPLSSASGSKSGTLDRNRGGGGGGGAGNNDYYAPNANNYNNQYYK
ncbi:uncharacterized protein LOC134853145 [Symsagittifera roscoffensis]|uniref:uncharacterized protein LOC134853145 n=1 Tax=Symsagittifera roscoffensis TaxID=84072 RepID=UPI00307B7D8A